MLYTCISEYWLCLVYIECFSLCSLSVFHPKCVDEWLRKWNRTCPLCKTSISRRRDRRSEDAPLLEADTEITSGNSTEDGRNRESYGTMNDQTENEEEREMPVVAIATVHGTSHLSPMAAAV